MNPEDFPTPDVDVPAVDPAALKRRIDAGEDLTLLDTRVESDYEQWHIDGESVDSINVPYYEFLDDDLDGDALDRIPRTDDVVVLCAKGGASECVAGKLLERGYQVTHLDEGMNGWGRIYDAADVQRYDGSGTLVQYHRPSSGCLSYLLHDGGEAAVVDPLRSFTDRYLADADDLGVELTYAFDTHVHADHVSGIRDLAAHGVEAVLPAAAADRGVAYADDVTLADDGDPFAIGGATVEAIHTPGHTTGMTSYLVDGAFVATGDGLFVESVARPDLENGDEGAPAAARTLYETLHGRLLELPDETLVGGGHASDAAETALDGTFTARLGDLVEEMDALTMDEEAFVDLVVSELPPRPANYEDIIATNLGRESVDDEEAFQLELGPNNCAASQDSLVGD